MPDSNLNQDTDYSVLRSLPQSIQTNGRNSAWIMQVTSPSRAVKLTAVSCQPLTAEVRIQTQARSQGICGGHSGTVAGIRPVLWFPCQCHSTNAPYSCLYVSNAK
jgi:hypothetical protein